MAKKILSPEQESELHRLHERLVLTITFFQKAEDFPSGDPMRVVIEQAVQRKDVRSLRVISRELDAMALALPSYQRDGLEAKLNVKLGVDRDAERTMEDEQVKRILARGRIASEKERRRLEEYVERTDVAGDASQAGAVRNLLSRSP